MPAGPVRNFSWDRGSFCNGCNSLNVSPSSLHHPRRWCNNWCSEALMLVVHDSLIHFSPAKSLVLEACPAGFEHATRGLEARNFLLPPRTATSSIVLQTR